jgi:hypothetical protein
MKKFFSSLAITILLSSCAGEKQKLTENVGKYVPPNIEDTNFKDFVITNNNFDETWTSIFDFVNDSFFKIENLEKDSGLLTLSFGSEEAEKFIDCGDFEYTLFFTGEEFKGSYIDYAKSGLLGVLEAKMNINIRKIDNESTKISINTNYTYSTQHALGYYDPKLNQTYSFKSGGYQTIDVINPIKGSIPTRTCKSTNFAENTIFNLIK